MATIATQAEIESVRRQPSLAFQISQASASPESVIVKGFVSTDSPDRTGLRIEPQEFDLEAFMAAPAVLVNHALWTDDQGVKGGVGVPTSIHQATVRRGVEPGTFSIYDTQTKREIDVVRKEQVPNLRLGVQGIYAFVKITNPDVVRMITSGELKAFSWRGVGNWGHTFEGGTAYRTLRGIDLWEISLVTMPANNESYAIMRSAIQGVTSAEDVTLKSLTGRVSQFVSHDSAKSSEVIRMVGGLSVILSSPGTSQMETPMSLNTPANEAQAASQTVPEPVAAAPVQQEAVQSAPAAPSASQQALTAPVDPNALAGLVAAQLAPLLTPLVETLRGLTESVAAFKKPAEAAPSASEVSPEAPAPAAAPAAAPQPDPAVELLRSLSAEVTQLKGLVGSITPPPREPRGESSAAPKADPNSVFDSFFRPVATRG